MACVRKRRGKWVVDYRDGAGIRRWVTCETRRDAGQRSTPDIRADLLWMTRIDGHCFLRCRPVSIG